MIDKKSVKTVLDDLQSHKTVEEYFRDNSYSYSKIKNCYTDPSSLFRRDRPPSIFMDIGSAVDIMLTDPLESDRIKAIKKIPSDTNINLVHYLLFNHPNVKTLDDVTDEMIKEAYNVISPKNRWTPEVQRTKFLDDADQYYRIKIENYDAIILTTDLYDIVLQIVTTLRTHEVTRHLFNSTFKNPDTLIYYQFSYKEEAYHDIPVKILIDIMEVNVKESTIQVYDLKVGDNSFFKSYWKFKWFYQAALYRSIADELCYKLSDILGMDNTDIPLFFTLPFKFIHIQPSKPQYPVIYQVSASTNNTIIYSGYKERTFYIPSLHKILNAAKFYNTYLSALPNTEDKIKKDLVPYYLVAENYTISI